MKPILAALLAIAASGCIIRTHHHHPDNRPVARSCPPNHHWEGGYCVHNRGPVVRDHR